MWSIIWRKSISKINKAWFWRDILPILTSYDGLSIKFEDHLIISYFRLPNMRIVDTFLNWIEFNHQHLIHIMKFSNSLFDNITSLTHPWLNEDRHTQLNKTILNSNSLLQYGLSSTFHDSAIKFNFRSLPSNLRI